MEDLTSNLSIAFILLLTLSALIFVIKIGVIDEIINKRIKLISGRIAKGNEAAALGTITIIIVGSGAALGIILSFYQIFK